MRVRILEKRILGHPETKNLKKPFFNQFMKFSIFSENKVWNSPKQSLLH